MKLQYLGDVSDYRKFALLRLLARAGGFKIGVCWMLTGADARSDGNRRAYLQQPAKWRAFDAELFDRLADVPNSPDLGDLGRIEVDGTIMNATFFNDETPDDRAGRETSHRACMTKFIGCDLAFFDPDNGLDVLSCRRGWKNSSKYAFVDELADHYAAGRSVLVYQHFPRQLRPAFLVNVCRRLSDALPGAALWVFETAHVAFVLAARPEHVGRIETAAREITERWPESFIKARRPEMVET